MDFATIRQEEENPAWDVEWQEAVGPLETLWALYKEMEEAGWRVDGRDYYTNFRVDTRGKPKEEWEALKERCVWGERRKGGREGGLFFPSIVSMQNSFGPRKGLKMKGYRENGRLLVSLFHRAALSFPPQ